MGMTKSFVYLLLTCLPLGSLFGQKQTSFDKLLEKIEQLNPEEKNKKLEIFVKTNGGTPIIEDNLAIFLVKNDTIQPVLLADFNGFMNPRYVKDHSLGKMKSIAGTSWYYSKKELLPEALINYRFYLGETQINDPSNPLKRINFGDSISFFSMSENKVPPKNNSYPKGQVSQTKLWSKHQNHERTIHVYLPAVYESLEALPTLYFHDGSFHLKEMGVPKVLDELIAEKKMEPLIAVFDDPVIRGKEYRGDTAYRDYIQKELIHYVDSMYKTSPKRDSRAVVGFSRGGMSALYLSHNTKMFGKVIAFSPAIHPKSVEEFSAELEAFGNAPDQIFITGSIYDHIWYKDAPALRDYFSQKATKLKYKEIPMGHNIASWGTLLDDILTVFYRVK